MATTRLPLDFIAVVALFLLISLVHAAGIPASSHGHESMLGRRAVTLNLQRNPNYKPNGLAAYARALKKWGAEVPTELTKSLAAMAGGGAGEVSAVTYRNDREYLSQVGFGTPLQWLNVDLDTGSADVWVYTSETRESVANGRLVFNLNASSTAHKVENTTWMITYGDGSAAWGNVYRDVVSLADITVDNATIESAVSASASLADDPYLDGIFGLAYDLPCQTSPEQPTVLSSLLPRLAQPVFTADLRWRSSAGAYTFGRVDAARHRAGARIAYTPLVDRARFWEFYYAGLHVGGQDRWYYHGAGEAGRWRAIADTGTTLLLLSADVAEMYYAAVPGAVRNRTVGGIWTYPCDVDAIAGGGGAYGHGAGAGAKKAGLPDFEVSFANGFVATVPGKFMNYTVMPDDPARCMGGLQEWGYGGLGIFGDVFLKAVYAVFDVGGGRIGFAEKELDLE